MTGNASDWVGGEMTRGLIRIRGNAGGQIGAAYRGSLAGMKRGTILDRRLGRASKSACGCGAASSPIAGPVRDFAGLQMKGGTIVLLGGAEIRTGAWMIRGTIISLKPLRLLPTFSYACAYNPAFFGSTRGTCKDAGLRFPVRTGGRGLSALHRRHLGARQGRNPRLAAARAPRGLPQAGRFHAADDLDR